MQVPWEQRNRGEFWYEALEALKSMASSKLLATANLIDIEKIH